MLPSKLLFIDFRDSFSYNLIGLIRASIENIKTIDYQDIGGEDLLSYEMIVLGPGPGHISDYECIFPELSKILGKTSLLGICLGHQIIGKLIGLSCSVLEAPIHGRALNLKNLSTYLGIEGIRAQFYNSWKLVEEVKISQEYHLIRDNGFIVGLFGPKVLGVQFHPESVGTNCPFEMFEKLTDLLYNGHYDFKTGRRIRPTNH